MNEYEGRERVPAVASQPEQSPGPVPGKVTRVARATGAPPTEPDRGGATSSAAALNRQIRLFEIQVNGEVEGHLRLQKNRDQHWIVGAVSETAGEAAEKTGELTRSFTEWIGSKHEPKHESPHIDPKIEMPEIEMWHDVRGWLAAAADDLFRVQTDPDRRSAIEAVKMDIESARTAFERCHRRLKEYQERAIEGAEVSAEALTRVVEICTEVEIVAAEMLGGPGVAADTAAAATLVFGGAQRGSELAHGLRQDFGFDELVLDATTEAAGTFAVSFVAGQLAKPFFRMLSGKVVASLTTEEVSELAKQLGVKTTKQALARLGESIATHWQKQLIELLTTELASPLKTAVIAAGRGLKGTAFDVHDFLHEVVSDMINTGAAVLIVDHLAAPHGGAHPGRSAHED